MKSVHVAVGVVIKNDTVFVCKRAADAHQGNLWEFPGGKVEAGETPLQALYRELFEEIDIKVNSATHLIDIAHQYSDKAVTLHVYKVTDFSGTATGKEGQPHEWRVLSDLSYQDFPVANRAIIDVLR